MENGSGSALHFRQIVSERREASLSVSLCFHRSTIELGKNMIFSKF